MTNRANLDAWRICLIPIFAFIAFGANAQNSLPATGNVGIGTTNPQYLLDVNGSLNALSYAGPLVGTPNGGISTPSSGLNDASVYDRITHFDGYGGAVPNAPDGSWWEGALTIGSSIRGVQIAGGYDTGSLYFRKGNSSWQTWTQLLPATNIQYSGSNVGIGTTNPGSRLEINGNLRLTSGSGAAITFADGTVQSTAYTGLTCGGDYAESVDSAEPRGSLEPGDVLVVDTVNAGKVLKSSESYSTIVSGVYSTKPGVVGRRQPTPKSDSEVPMAMLGIVPTKVSAENGPIRLGDLLVTASRAGYAMKGTDRNRMLGSVIGKAMGTLDAGFGTIEVLITLQ